jgi:hypothetical protein
MTEAKETVHIFPSECRRTFQWFVESIVNPARCSNGFLILARGVLLILFASLITSASSAAAGDGRIPPFTAKGIVSIEVFQKPGVPAVLKTEEDVFFTYSNGLWQVELKGRPGGFQTTIPLQTIAPFPKGVSAGGLPESISNCKNISGGVRYITTARSVQDIAVASNIWRHAFVEPTPFPPPETVSMFVCWLALSPNPELPLIDGNKMRRLLSADFIKNPKNQGEYTLQYISPDNIFISELSITNDGIGLLPDRTLMKWSPPFDKGYLEFEYKVLETTNWNGVSFPSRAILHKYFPLPNGTNRNDLFATVVARLDMKSFHAGIESPYVDLSHSKLFAHDNRLPHLPELGPIRYVVTNDQWVAATNTALAQFAADYNTAMKPRVRDASGTTAHKRLAVIIVMVILTLGPVTALILGRKTRNSGKDKTL